MMYNICIISEISIKMGEMREKTIQLGSIIFLSLFVDLLEEDTRGSYTSSKGQSVNSERSRYQWGFRAQVNFCCIVQNIHLLPHRHGQCVQRLITQCAGTHNCGNVLLDKCERLWPGQSKSQLLRDWSATKI